MPKIDLITGFLGSGKTTFIRKYAAYLLKKGEHIGILENDFGAVNVDTMLLSDMEGESCGLEMIAGGCCQDPDSHRRRFKTKLIAMRMDGYDRVIVEPSGIYETEEFFDTLQEEPLESWYEIGNVIALADAGLEEDLSPEAEYLLASQVSCAGAVVITKSGGVPPEQTHKVIAHLNRAMEKTRCLRRFRDEQDRANADEQQLEDMQNCIPVPARSENTQDSLVLRDEPIIRDTNALTEDDLERLANCGYVTESCAKTIYDPDHAFDSLFFMHPQISAGKVEEAVRRIFADQACGQVMRVKGFLHAPAGGKAESAQAEDLPAWGVPAGSTKAPDAAAVNPKGKGVPAAETEDAAETGACAEDAAAALWLELNATPAHTELKALSRGQEIIIVIGQGLNEEKIGEYLQ